ncbi:hypothetical protein [Thomasclavelia cocleata]|uniref:hypothetical protein n=1 Tax=Thomasclavelia cocleata TaxID=69824 RepID=UPI0024321B5C|nr:hypothetical protein [Thomasclavelia cocleata]
MDEKIVKMGKNKEERNDRKKVIKIITEYVKKLNDSDLDKVLDYLNKIFAN